MSKPFILDPVKEAKAVAAIRASLAAVGQADDAQLLLDTVEGETSLLEVIDALLLRRHENLSLAEGLKTGIEALEARKARFLLNAERDKTLVEQALSVAELDTLMRPAGTLSMAKRAASVVITEESEIPGAYWKTPAPVLDKKALGEAVKAHHAALAITDEQLRKAALAEAPAVPGATLNNAAPSLTIRVR